MCICVFWCVCWIYLKITLINIYDMLILVSDLKQAVCHIQPMRLRTSLRNSTMFYEHRPLTGHLNWWLGPPTLSVQLNKVEASCVHSSSRTNEWMAHFLTTCQECLLKFDFQHGKQTQIKQLLCFSSLLVSFLFLTSPSLCQYSGTYTTSPSDW